VPGKVEICRCGAPRGDAEVSSNLPASPAQPAPPAQPTFTGEAAHPTISGSAFAMRIVLGIVLIGGLGAGWYVWTKNSENERAAAIARVNAARARTSPAVQSTTQAAGGIALPSRVASTLTPNAAQPDAAPAADGAAAAVPLEDLVSRVGPAVVLIQSSRGRGTGFFVDTDTIITNAHVVEGDSVVRIRRSNGDTTDARVERAATDIDVAVLRVSSRLDNQAVLPLGSVANVRSGQEVVAIGSPSGLQNTVTRGIVSAVRTSDKLTLIQTDAAINPGNSGGPLIDRAGTAIGINALTSRSTQGISFAIAADHATELLSGRHFTTTTSTPLSTLNDNLTGKSDTDRARESAVVRYERALAQLARRADNLDVSWRRFRGDCYRGSIIGNFDREWFAILQPRAMQGAVAPGCGGDFAQERQEANTIRNTVEALDEAARKEDILPGTRRDLRHKYRLEWDR
jgi:streptomycin 6-kinase